LTIFALCFKIISLAIYKWVSEEIVYSTIVIKYMKKLYNKKIKSMSKWIKTKRNNHIDKD